MTQKNPVPAVKSPRTTSDEAEAAAALNDMDLSPLGLADAPAKGEDEDSVVHAGNS